VVWFYLTDRPADAKWLEPEERNWLQGRLDAERANREAIVKLSWKQSLTSPRVIALGFVYMGIVVPLYGLTFFLPQILKALPGISNTQAILVNFFPFAIGAVCMVLWGRFSDATGERKWSTIFPCAMIALGLVLASYTDDLTLKVVAVSLAAFGIFSALAVFWTLPTAYLSGAAAAAGIAWINSIGNLGGYLGPTVFGGLRDHFDGDFYGMLFLAALALLAVVLVLVLGHDRRMEQAGSEAAAE
jgi:nitrate/nitrite transporter NarK